MNENLAALRITNKNDGKSLPVPNYYWKVILKVKREGTSISDAGAIGFWLPHKDLKGHEYSDYVVSVDTIEEWTGFDFFVNVPDEKEKPAETNMSWQAFISF
jgi:endonuclease G